MTPPPPHTHLPEYILNTDHVLLCETVSQINPLKIITSLLSGYLSRKITVIFWMYSCAETNFVLVRLVQCFLRILWVHFTHLYTHTLTVTHTHTHIFNPWFARYLSESLKLKSYTYVFLFLLSQWLFNFSSSVWQFIDWYVIFCDDSYDYLA